MADPETLDDYHQIQQDLSPFGAAILADRLGFFALALFVFYAVNILASTMPPQLLNPIWQLTSIKIVLDTAAIPLLGLALFHLASYIDPGNIQLQQRKNLIARLAILATIGFLLIIPLQSYAAWSTFRQAHSSVDRQQTLTNETAGLLREAIQEASSTEDLQQRLRNLQRPDLRLRINDEAFLDQPLPELKQRLLSRVNQAVVKVRSGLRRPNSGAVGDLARNTLRIIISSAALAFAFAAGAQRKGRELPLLVEWHIMWLNLTADKAAAKTDPSMIRLPIPASPTKLEEAYFEQLVQEGEDPVPPQDS